MDISAITETQQLPVQQHQQQQVTNVGGKCSDPSSGGRRANYRTVTFGLKVNVLVIPNLSSYTKTQIKRMWYQQGDYLSMKCTRTMEIANLVKRRRNNSILVKMNITAKSTTTTQEGNTNMKLNCSVVAGDDGDDDDDDEYIIGLCTPQQREEQLYRIYQSQMAVFEEQDLQREENLIDEELLADVYFDMTRISQHEALERAKRLARNQQRKIQQRPRQEQQQLNHHEQQQYHQTLQPIADIAEHITTSLKVQPTTSALPIRRFVVERRSLLLTSITIKATKLQMTRCL